MNLPEFLRTWTTVDELKSVLYVYDQPRTGTKELLINRIAELTEASPVEILTLLNNATLQGALRSKGLPTGGKKSELVIRLVGNRVVEFDEDEILSFLESVSKDDFSAYHEILLCGARCEQIERAGRLLAKAAEEHLKVFVKLFRSSGDAGKTARVLVSLFVQRTGNVPSFAAFILESLIEAEGSVTAVAPVIDAMSDEIMARQRRIRKSFAKHPRLSHPAVDSLLHNVWTGEFRRGASLLEGVRSEVRTGSRKVETALRALRDPAQAEALSDVSRRTARIESTTEDIQRGVQTLHEQLQDVQEEIRESPERVAHALEELSQTRDVKWRARRKIKRDLQTFWSLTDRAQKVDFLGRAIMTYGPVVLSAIRGLL